MPRLSPGHIFHPQVSIPIGTLTYTFLPAVGPILFLVEAEDAVDIGLRDQHLLHLGARGFVRGVGLPLLFELVRVLRFELLHRRNFPADAVEGLLRAAVLFDLGRVHLAESFAVAGGTVGGVDLSRLGIADDLIFERGDFGEPVLARLDLCGELREARAGIRRFFFSAA